MRVCWFGIYDKEYSRNKILIDGLESNGVTVVECNYQGKGILKYISLFKRLRVLNNEYDYLYCAFPVHVSILIAFFFQKKPIVVDAFFSKYEAVILDRKVYSKYHPKALVFIVLDALMVFLADEIIVDTKEHKKYFSKWRDAKYIHVIPVGVHTKEFFPQKNKKQRSDFLVQFHGSYIPLQGIHAIVEAALILNTEKNIQFRFIGNGQEYEKIRKLVSEYNLNVEFLPWLSIAELNTRLNEADIILGIFGDTEKTNRVVPNKLYQGLAVCKPVITKDTKAVRERFTSNQIFMIENSPEKLAESILFLYKNSQFRLDLAECGYLKIVDEFTERQIGLQLLKVFTKIQ